MTTIADDVALLLEAVTQGGDVALGYFQSKTLKSWDKSKGHAVTEADIAVNTHLETTLKAARPNYGWLSEESPPTKSGRNKARNFIIDPIDGTSAFMAGRADWCVAAAVEEAGQITAAAVYVPVKRTSFHAGLGMGAWRGTTRIRVAPHNAAPRRIICKKRDYVTLSPDENTQVSVPPYALILRLARVAEGEADALIASGYKSDWDIAAGALLVTEAGGRVSTMTGSKLKFNCLQPVQYNVLAASSACYDSLIFPSKSPI